MTKDLLQGSNIPNQRIEIKSEIKSNRFCSTAWRFLRKNQFDFTAHLFVMSYTVAETWLIIENESLKEGTELKSAVDETYCFTYSKSESDSEREVEQRKETESIKEQKERSRIAQDHILSFVNLGRADARAGQKALFKCGLPESKTERLSLATKMADHLNEHTFAVSHGSQIDQMATKIPYGDKPALKSFNEKLEHVSLSLTKEVNMDTFAVGVTDNGKILVSCNKKTRDIASKEKSEKFFKYSEFGAAGNKQEIKDIIKKRFPESKNCEIILVEPSIMPKTPQENQKSHAEMQLVAHSKKTGEDMVIGVSKPECSKCKDVLEDRGIQSRSVQSKDQNKNPKNWEDPDLTRVKSEKIVKKPKVAVAHNLGNNLKSVKSMAKSAYTPQISKPTKPKFVKDAGKSTLKQMKPGAGASLGRTIESVIEDHDKEGSASADTLVAEAGTYKGRVSTGAFAKAVTAEASASYSVFSAAARGPGASAGAHAGISGVSAMATAELARAEASAAGASIGVGLSLDTGASIGVDGVSASVAGFGISIGPKMGIKTPIIDATISCSVM